MEAHRTAGQPRVDLDVDLGQRLLAVGVGHNQLAVVVDGLHRQRTGKRALPAHEAAAAHFDEHVLALELGWQRKLSLHRIRGERERVLALRLHPGVAAVAVLHERIGRERELDIHAVVAHFAVGEVLVPHDHRATFERHFEHRLRSGELTLALTAIRDVAAARLLALSFVQLRDHSAKQVAPPRDRVIEVGRGDGACTRVLVAKQIQVARKVVVLQLRRYRIAADARKRSGRFLHPVLQDQVVGRDQPLLVAETRLVRQDLHEALVLLR